MPSATPLGRTRPNRGDGGRQAVSEPFPSGPNDASPRGDHQWPATLSVHAPQLRGPRQPAALCDQAGLAAPATSAPESSRLIRGPAPPSAAARAARRTGRPQKKLGGCPECAAKGVLCWSWTRGFVEGARFALPRGPSRGLEVVTAAQVAAPSYFARHLWAVGGRPKGKQGQRCCCWTAASASRGRGARTRLFLQAGGSSRWHGQPERLGRSPHARTLWTHGSRPATRSARDRKAWARPAFELGARESAPRRGIGTVTGSAR
jgi:hypothetical protein